MKLAIYTFLLISLTEFCTCSTLGCGKGYWNDADEGEETECESCDCDPVGSHDQTCDARTGQCQCKSGVSGRRCNSCLPNFYAFSEEGCQDCECYVPGTDDSESCNPTNGKCHCKPNVIGKKCNRCMREYWGLGSEEGCIPCACDPTGSLNPRCDDLTGQCQCRAGTTGQRCIASVPVRESRSCEKPPVFDGASIQESRGSDYTEGTVVTYTCDMGYVADKDSFTSRCVLDKDDDTLEWTDPGITCSPRSCGYPGTVPHGQRTGHLFTFPNSVSFHCDEGYRLNGNSKIYCHATGRWSGSLPTCGVLKCPIPESPKNGRVEHSSLEFGSELKYQCDTGYVLKNREVRFCSGDGEWSGQEAECVESQCEVPIAPTHGSANVFGDASQPPKAGSIVHYACHGNRKLVGSLTSKCLVTGEWTFPAPQCVDPCNVPEVPNGKIIRKYLRSTLAVGTVVEEGKEYVLQCNSNYRTVGKPLTSATVSCRDRKWSKILECVRAGCNSRPPPVENAVLKSNKWEHGDFAVYHCNANFKKIPGAMVCDSGRWTGAPPTCVDTRCYVKDLASTGLKREQVPEYILNGRTYNPVCVEGYHHSNPEDNSLKCIEGKWDGHLPPCKPADCIEDPPKSSHAILKQHSKLHGENAVYQCEDSYLLESTGNVNCLFGKWKGPLP